MGAETSQIFLVRAKQEQNGKILKGNQKRFAN
jgi:hypothetical protein